MQVLFEDVGVDHFHLHLGDVSLLVWKVRNSVVDEPLLLVCICEVR